MHLNPIGRRHDETDISSWHGSLPLRPVRESSHYHVLSCDGCLSLIIRARHSLPRFGPHARALTVLGSGRLPTRAPG